MSDKPECYVIADLLVHDAEKFAEYRSKAIPMLESYGGAIVAISSGAPQALQGEPRAANAVTVIQRWPSHDHMLAFFQAEEYQPVLPLRLESTSGTIVALENLLPPS